MTRKILAMRERNMKLQKDTIRKAVLFGMRLFLAIFFLFLAFKTFDKLSFARDAMLGIGCPFVLSGLLAYFYDGLIFTLSFSFLLKTEWLASASLLGFIVIAFVSALFIIELSGGGSSCKACPAASKDAVTILSVIGTQTSALFFCLVLFLKSSDTKKELCVL